MLLFIFLVPFGSAQGTRKGRKNQFRWLSGAETTETYLPTSSTTEEEYCLSGSKPLLHFLSKKCKCQLIGFFGSFFVVVGIAWVGEGVFGVETIDRIFLFQGV